MNPEYESKPSEIKQKMWQMKALSAALTMNPVGGLDTSSLDDSSAHPNDHFIYDGEAWNDEASQLNGYGALREQWYKEQIAYWAIVNPDGQVAYGGAAQHGVSSGI